MISGQCFHCKQTEYLEEKPDRDGHHRCLSCRIYRKNHGGQDDPLRKGIGLLPPLPEEDEIVNRYEWSREAPEPPGVDVAIAKAFRYAECPQCHRMNNHPDGRIVMRQGGHRQLGTWWEGVFDRGLFSCESCGIHYHPTIALPERHGSLDETGALVMPESELPRIPTPNEQMEAYEEQGGERKFNSLVEHARHQSDIV